MTLLPLIPALPLVAALLCAAPVGRRIALGATILSAVAALLAAVTLAGQVVRVGRVVDATGWLAIDGLGALVLLLASFVATVAALFSWGYLARNQEVGDRTTAYCMHFNLFVFALVLVPLMTNPILAWIAIEFTAVFSVLLVAFENTHEALEAAWKYIALMFMGAAVALLGFFILFWAQQRAGGGAYTWAGLRAASPSLAPVLVGPGVLLVLVGFGAKVGFVPMHTWLPDAHSQAPSPVCALLSGVKTSMALYCILRLVPLEPSASWMVLLRTVGLVSAGVAAFLLLQVRDYKRMFAYSTVEHMGIIAVGTGLDGPHAWSASMLQLVNHGLTKAFCFLAAGAVLLVVGTREIVSVRGLSRVSPGAATALLIGALAIGGAPPFAVFLSEFAIFRSGLEQGHYLTITLLALFVVVAFFGILLHVGRMLSGPSAPVGAPGSTSGLPASCIAALVLAAMPVVVLGLYEPGSLHTLLGLAAAALSPGVHP